jgi:hypothetical protein
MGTWPSSSRPCSRHSNDPGHAGLGPTFRLGGRSFDIVLLGLLAALVVLAFLTDEEQREPRSSTSPPRRPASPPSPSAKLPAVRLVSRRVVALRRLRFRAPPQVRVIRARKARAEGLAKVDEGFPVEQRRADEEVLKLLGLLAPADDLRDIAGSLFGEEVAAYYEPSRQRLTLIREAYGDDTEFDQVVLAHELTHALEDQRFRAGLDEPEPGTDDRASAEAALFEGTATVVMIDYARRHLGFEGRRSLFIEALSGASAESDLPPYIEASELFPYLAGGRFVNRLYRLARGWKLIDAALRARLPTSTEQIIHPTKYLIDERPRPLQMAVQPQLGRGWRRVAAGSLGEFDTDQILRRGVPSASARRAAAGWGGGRYELWRRGALVSRTCPAPCRRRDALVLAWTWDSRGDAREFASAVRAWVERALGGKARGSDRFQIRDGAAALNVRPRGTTLVLAPSSALAARLAARGVE